MTILAKSYNENYIITAHANELANILGYKYATSMPNKQDQLEIGKEIKLNEIFEFNEKIKDGEILENAFRLKNIATDIVELSEKIIKEQKK